MKRQTLVEYKDASPEVQKIYDEIRETTSNTEIPNYLKALGNNENILRAVWSMTKHTVIDGEIPSLLKQLILFKISVHLGNRYCSAFHGNAALNLDPTLSYDDLIKLSEGKTSLNLPSSFQVAIEIVSNSALKPESIVKNDINYEERLRDEGFSLHEIDELMAQGYFATMMNTFINSCDIPWEKPFPPEE